MAILEKERERSKERENEHHRGCRCATFAELCPPPFSPSSEFSAVFFLLDFGSLFSLTPLF